MWHRHPNRNQMNRNKVHLSLLNKVKDGNHRKLKLIFKKKDKRKKKREVMILFVYLVRTVTTTKSVKIQVVMEYMNMILNVLVS